VVQNAESKNQNTKSKMQKGLLILTSKKVKNLRKFFSIFLIGAFVLAPFSNINSMQSLNYIIDKDSINFGGSDNSESESYKLSDTMGEIGTEEMQERCSAMSFDGVDDYVDLGNDESLQSGGAITVSLWVYRNGEATTGQKQAFISKAYDNTSTKPYDSYAIFYDRDNNNELEFFLGFTSGDHIKAITTGVSLDLQKWYHIVVTYDGYAKIYVNNENVYTSSYIGETIKYYTDSLLLGKVRTSDSRESFNGSMDDARIYNRALSATEISDLYKGNHIDNTGLVGAWGFDEGSGSTTADLSGSGNTGTIYGATFADDFPLSTCNIFNAGYREMLPTYLSISSPSDVTMSPTIGGLSGGTGNGSAVWNVKTDNPAGYQVSVRSSTDPALQTGTYSFADYTPDSVGTPDFTWGIATADSEFGYTVEGANAVSKFLDNGSVCNSGSGNTADKCWFPFSTSDSSVINSTSPNHPLGTDTTIKFKAQSGSNHFQGEGVYAATIVVTAVAL